MDSQMLKALEAKEIAGYKAKPQTQAEIELWLDEQVWENFETEESSGQETSE